MKQKGLEYLILTLDLKGVMRLREDSKVQCSQSTVR